MIKTGPFASECQNRNEFRTVYVLLKNYIYIYTIQYTYDLSLIFFQNMCYACMPFAKRDYSESETSDDGSTDDDDT